MNNADTSDRRTKAEREEEYERILAELDRIIEDQERQIEELIKKHNINPDDLYV